MSRPDEDLRRRTAFEEYYNLPKLGIKRNRNAYYEYCIQRNRDDPASRATIPTTNRSTIYKWHAEDKWEERCLEREIQLQENLSKTYEDLRQLGYHRMNGMIQDAIFALHELIRPPKDEKGKVRSVDANVQLRAIQTLLDRVGLGVEKSSQNRHVVGAPDAGKIESEPAPIDGTEDDMIAYLSKTREDLNE